MHFLVSLATLAVAVSAKAVKRDAAGLDIQLTSAGNTLVKAVITNKNSIGVALLNKGTILDPAHVEKITVSGNSKFCFDAIYCNIL